MSEQTTIGRYRITAELGRGGMGVVYKAWEESLQRYVAIKMLGDALAHDEALVERFLREARAVADLSHPNVVQVFTVDTHEGRPYFAMEYVEEGVAKLFRCAQSLDFALHDPRALLGNGVHACRRFAAPWPGSTGVHSQTSSDLHPAPRRGNECVIRVRWSPSTRTPPS